MDNAKKVRQQRVLFADDDAFYRDMGAGALADAGYDVVEAGDGAQALDVLDPAQASGAPVDLIVLDLEMPGLSGYDVMTKIRNEYSDQHIPIIVITGHEDTQSVERAFTLGATSFLAKPLNWSLFVHHVKFVLKADESRREAREATRTAESMSGLKSRLISMLVNEFQSPLQSAYGFATLLKQETDGPIQSQLYKSWIDEVATSLQKLRSTHVKMLNFGQSLTDGLTIKSDIVALEALVTDAVAATQDAMHRRQLTLVVNHNAPRRLRLEADPVLLLQAVRTVLDHAEQFSHRSSTVELETNINADGALVIAVRDTTPALNPRQIAAALGLEAPAQQNRGSNKAESTGLGMSRVLLEAHQGQMQMSPLPGGGMLTELILPKSRIVQADAAAAPLQRPAPSSLRNVA
jgi:two-component system, sensor histidine kinase and response regulator